MKWPWPAVKNSENTGRNGLISMNSANREALYEFGGYVLDPAKRLLLREGREVVTIGPKAFDALVYLLEHAGQMVERADLAAALWPNTVVEDNNLSQTILALRRALGEAENGQCFVLTVPRRGYQFVAQVLRKRIQEAAEPSSIATESPTPHSARRSLAWKVAGAVCALAFVTALGLWVRQHDSIGEKNKSVAPRTIAVLPFANLSPNPQDAYFAAGMHEEVMTRLAKLQGVTVIARTAVQQYAKDESRSIETIAQDLDADTLMEGSVRYAADRVRVSVRLMGSSGKELWSETYEAPLRDVFDIQTNIATRIADALESKLSPTERANLSIRPTESMEAYALYLKALVSYRSGGAIGVSMPPQMRREINVLLEQALMLDPRFAAALGWRAQISADTLQFDSFPIAERTERVAALTTSIERDARAALSIEPSLGIAHAALMRRLFFEHRLGEALTVFEQAERAAPDDTFVWQAAAVLHCARNDLDAAIRAARRAIELDSRNPGPHSLLAIALHADGKTDAAIAAYERMIELAPNAVIGYIGLARTLTAKNDTPRLRETLKIVEQFLGSVRNARVDAAISYAGIGAHADARRLIAEFRSDMQGQYVDPALEAMAHLALTDHARAKDALRAVLSMRRRGMDQLPIVLIRYNSWSDPLLETAEWKRLREELAYNGE